MQGSLRTSPFDGPPGAEIKEAVATALETTDPGQARGSFIHDEVQLILDNLNLGSARAGVTSPSPFDQPPGAEIKEAVATALETTDPGQARGSSIPDAVQDALDDLNLGNTGAGVTPPGADIWEELTSALETEPGPALASFIHDAVHGILDLNLGNTGAGVTPPGAGIREAVTAALETTEPGQALVSFIHDAFHEILDDLDLGTIGSFIHDAVHEILEVNPVLDPFGQGLSEFIHDFRSDWHLM